MSHGPYTGGCDPQPCNATTPFHYFTLAPVLSNDMLFLGERDKIVALSRQRTHAITVTNDGLQAGLAGKPGEDVTMSVAFPENTRNGRTVIATTCTLGEDGGAELVCSIPNRECLCQS